MNDLQNAVGDFLAQRRIAVAGVSRTDSAAPANLVYRKLRDAGYAVTPVNPHAEQVEGDACAPDLASIDGGVDGVVVATPPGEAEKIVQECAALGIRRVWMHRSFGQGSVSDAAVARCHEHGIRVIAGACPMMFCEPVDVPHRCLRWVLKVTGKLPKPSERRQN
jgi:predicted CoA-binding protein